jgi:serine/threonine protein kinase
LTPEIVENQSYDFKADVWCLGIVLYEILALEVPFSANSIAALAIRICTAEAKPVSALYGHETRSLLAKMLSKNAGQRPSMDEIACLPLVRRAIDARTNCTECTAETGNKTIKEEEDLQFSPRCDDSRNSDCNSSELRDTFDVHGVSITGSQSLHGAWSVDLTEVERLLSSPSPVRKLRGSPKISSLSPAKPLPPQYPPPTHVGRSLSSLSMSLGDLELHSRFHGYTSEEGDGMNRELSLLLGGTSLGESPMKKKISESSVTCSYMLRNLEKDFGFV